MSVKAQVKQMVGQTLIRTGVWKSLLRRCAKRSEAIILTYHRVIEKWDRTLDYSQPGMVVTADTFDRQLAFLKKYFQIVPLSYFVNPQSEIRNPKSSDSLNPQSEIRNPKSPDRPLCSITFDDGWHDNYEIAFPILQKHGAPATIFLTTDFIGANRAFWHTELIYLLMQRDLSRLNVNQNVFQSCPSPVRHRLMHLGRMTEEPSAHDVDPVIEAVKETYDEDGVEELIRELSEAVGLCRPLFSGREFFLDWNHVREMAHMGIEIGSHGCSHRVLTRLKSEEAEEELVRSKAEIERQIDQVVRHFAFPIGAANRDLLASVENAGYQTACLCASGVDNVKVGPLALRRQGMSEAVSGGYDGSFLDSRLALWLLRAPRMKPA